MFFALISLIFKKAFVATLCKCIFSGKVDDAIQQKNFD